MVVFLVVTLLAGRRILGDLGPRDKSSRAP